MELGRNGNGRLGNIKRDPQTVGNSRSQEDSNDSNF